MRRFIIFILMVLCMVEVSAQEKNKFTIVDNQSVMIMGISCKTSNAAASVDIPKLWDKFLSENVVENIPNKVSSDVFALYCDYEGDCTKPYSLVIGCQVDPLDTIPDGLVAKTIPSGYYAVYSAKGEHPQAVIETWESIWQDPDLKRTYTGDYELYSPKFQEGEVEVFIAIDNSI
ncbi:MAG: GyrI-like domain-containing protein [Parachlamydia sp.]|jgi:predicted transcriptional regulator YdeE|nr:GyrI-like domain-containing protein [Parachlamydia sp.]